MISPELMRCMGVICFRRAMVERVQMSDYSEDDERGREGSRDMYDRWCGVVDVASSERRLKVGPRIFKMTLGIIFSLMGSVSHRLCDRRPWWLCDVSASAVEPDIEQASVA